VRCADFWLIPLPGGCHTFHRSPSLLTISSEADENAYNRNRIEEMTQLKGDDENNPVTANARCCRDSYNYGQR